MFSRKDTTKSIYNKIIKSSAVLLLFFSSILIISCSSNGSSQIDPGTPIATVTIKLGQDAGSPTPPLSNYYCGGWATDTSPAFSTTSKVSVFGKVTHTVTIDGSSNPEGVNNATATAIIQWPDGTRDTLSVTTTSDGLAVFPIAIKASAVNKLVTIMISFTSAQGALLCNIPSAAYFTAIIVSPTPTKKAEPTGTPRDNGTPTNNPSPVPTH